MDTIGVDGLRGGLPVALRREGTESVDPDWGGYAGHGCCRDAWGCAGACKIQTHYMNCRVHASHTQKIEKYIFVVAHSLKNVL